MADNSLLFRSWKNDKGSVVKFNEGKQLSQSSWEILGEYQTAVGNAPSQSYPLRGICQRLEKTDVNVVENKVEFLVSFCVQWTELKDPEKPKSGTAWSGQVIWDEENQRYLMSTLWVLTSKHLFHNVWKATTIEKDIFLPL